MYFIVYIDQYNPDTKQIELVGQGIGEMSIE
jgi:hypothetical protein